jgi:hypothetical protein
LKKLKNELSAGKISWIKDKTDKGIIFAHYYEIKLWTEENS